MLGFLLLLLLPHLAKGGWMSNIGLRCTRGLALAEIPAVAGCSWFTAATVATTTALTGGAAAPAAPATGGLSWAACIGAANAAGCTIDVVQGEFRAWWQVSGGIDACFEPDFPMGKLAAPGDTYIYCNLDGETTTLLRLKPKEEVVVPIFQITSSDGVELEVSFTYTVDGNYTDEKIKRALLRHKSADHGVSLVESLFETQMRTCLNMYADTFAEKQLKDPLFFVKTFPVKLLEWFEAVLGIPPPFTLVFKGRTVARY